MMTARVMPTPSFSAARGLQRPTATPLPIASAPSLSRCPPRRRRSPRRPRNKPRPPSAFFADDPGSLLSSLVDGVLVSAVVGGILLSALPLYSESAGRAARRRAGSRRALAVRGAEDAKALSSSSKEPSSSPSFSSSSSSRTDRELEEAEADLDEEEGLKWGLAAVVACLPLVGFTAWAFCAVDEAAAAASSSSSSSSPSSSRAPLYWAFAGIYALASLRHGLSLDAGAVAVALACAAHVQVERASSSFALGRDGERGSGGEEEDFEELFGRKTPAQAAAEGASKAAARAAGAAADSAAAVARAVRAGVSDDDGDDGDGEEEFQGGGSERGGDRRRRALPADTRRRAPTKEDLADHRYDKELLRSFDERLRERAAERMEEGKEEQR